MKKSSNLSLFCFGFCSFMAASIFMKGTVQLRLLHTPSGEIMLQPNGKPVFEHDTFAQFKEDWVSYLLITVGLCCWGWVIIRAIIWSFRKNLR